MDRCYLMKISIYHEGIMNKDKYLNSQKDHLINQLPQLTDQNGHLKLRKTIPLLTQQK